MKNEKIIKRWAIKQGSAISQTRASGYGKRKRNQNVLAIFPSKKQAQEWRKTWRNSESLKLIRIEIKELLTNK